MEKITPTMIIIAFVLLALSVCSVYLVIDKQKDEVIGYTFHGKPITKRDLEDGN